KYSIPKDQICFHATHNHSGPQTSRKFSKQLGQVSNTYMDFLKECIMDSVKAAKADKEEVSVEVSKGESNVGIYRRKEADGKIKMKPNPDIPTDNELTTISFKKTNDTTKAVWIHYTCHPTTTDANIFSSEFTGVCCDKLEDRYPYTTFTFLQGFCGDIRPNLVSNHQFYSGSIKDMEEMGNRFSNDVLNMIHSGKKVKDTGGFYCKRLVLPLRFSNEDVSRFIPDSLKSEWPELVKDKKKDEYYLIIQHINIFDELSFLACNAELVQAYSFFVRRMNKNPLPLGYSNGVVGYVPTSKQLVEGGYESLESIFYFGYPSIIAADMEQRIKNNFQTILEGK